MPINRFYLNAEYAVGATVCLTGSEHHHLSRVLRLRPGEEVELANGNGALAHARLSDVEKELSSLEILSAAKSSPSLFRVSLAIPLMRPSKLEWIAEKGTELGADAFLFYRSDHSEKEALSEHQLERLRSILISALKQSGRLYLPSLELLPHLESLFSRQALFLFGDIRPSAPPLSPSLSQTDQPVLFITGPESGFSESEQVLLDQKARGVRLNPNILRAETAPIAAISILNIRRLR